jgi:hypothetical protein
MTSTISSATLTVTHTEALTLNGVDRGVTNTFTVGSINEVDHRIMTCLHSGLQTVAVFGTAVAAGTYIKTNVKYIRLTNKDDTNFITIGLIDTGAKSTYLKLEAGQTFTFYNPSLDCDDNNSGAAFSSFTDLDTINAQADTASCDLEVFIAST